MPIIVEKADFIHYDLFILHFVMCFIDVVWLKFPAAGNCNNGSVKNVGNNGNYWSSSLNTNNRQNAYNLNFNSNNANWDNNNRYYGYAVRPVVGLSTRLRSFYAISICLLMAFFFVIYIYSYVYCYKNKIVIRFILCVSMRKEA